MIGNTFNRLTGHPAIVVTISGILLLVPGSIGLKGVSAFIIDKNVVQGMQFGFNMLIIALSIAVGLLIVNLLFRYIASAPSGT